MVWFGCADGSTSQPAVSSVKDGVGLLRAVVATDLYVSATLLRATGLSVNIQASQHHTEIKFITYLCYLILNYRYRCEAYALTR